MMMLSLSEGYINVDPCNEYSNKVLITNTTNLKVIATELVGDDNDEAMLLVGRLNDVLRSANELGTVMFEIVDNGLENILVIAEPEVICNEWSF